MKKLEGKQYKLGNRKDGQNVSGVTWEFASMYAYCN